MSFRIWKWWRERRDSSSIVSDLDILERRAEAFIRWFKALEYASAAVVLLGVVLDDTTWPTDAFGHASFWSSLKTWHVGGAMIAMGIALETLFSMLVSGREKRVSSINAQRRVEAEAKTAEALQEVANANIALVQEQAARLTIEQRLTETQLQLARIKEPRWWDQFSVAKNLQELKGIRFGWRTVPDSEAERVGTKLLNTCIGAGWELAREMISQSPLLLVRNLELEGILIEANVPPPTGQIDQSNAAAIMLVAQLMEYGVEARIDLRGIRNMPPLWPHSTIMIHVGLKPID
jgi:hypothetical protein